MKKTLCFAIAALTLSPLAIASPLALADDHSPVKISTKKGLVISSEDDAYSLKLDGRIQYDYNNYDGVFNADKAGETGSDFFFRRVRLGLSGTMAKDWDYKVEWNIRDGEGGDYEDLYIQYKGWGSNAQLTFGNVRQPFGFENITSSKVITAIERSAPSQLFDSGRSIGVMFSGYGDQWTYAAGVFEAGQDSDDAVDHSYILRGTYLPVSSDSGVLHLGVAARKVEGAIDSMRVRPELRDVDSSDRISAGISGDASGFEATALELAGTYNSFHFSSEYFSGSADHDLGPNLDFDAYYVQAGWFITGEQRPYSSKKGAFDTVKPSAEGGAWEVFARISETNLANNVEVNGLPVALGNDAQVTTLGVNWYANKYVRTGVNIVMADYDKPINGEDDGTGIAARLQLIF